MINKDQYNVPCIVNKISDDYKSGTKILNVSVPGSKSITNRALLLAALSDGKTVLNGCLFSDDSRNFLNCICNLGIEAIADESTGKVIICGCGGVIPKKKASVYVGSAGTAARFITAVLALSEGEYYIDASEQMRKRPMEPLFKALEELGCKMEWGSESQKYHFPVKLNSHGFCKNNITINIDKSSQFLSALMIASVMSHDDFTINIDGSHGMAYIDMTRKMMEQFGVSCQPSENNKGFSIRSGQKYHCTNYEIEPDYSAAAYFYAMSPILGIRVAVKGYKYDSLQGDIALIDVFNKMGCSVELQKEGLILNPPKDGHIKGLEVDMSSFSDQAITLAAVSIFADSPTEIKGIGHIRLQECDRLSGIAKELTRLGIKADEKNDEIEIFPSDSPKQADPVYIETYNDHRMAMGFSLVGLRRENVYIKDPLCCRKTFENYFEMFDEVCNQLL